MKSDERGSITPLAIGLAIISLSAILVVYAATSLFIFQKRLTNFSESAVVYLANASGDLPEFVSRIWNPGFTEQHFEHRLLGDGATHQVSTCAIWISPIPLFWLQGHVQVCANAKARSG